ncbi:MAG: hypothetical protein RLZZ181_111 [Pseudomonadota bacterium]
MNPEQVPIPLEKTIKIINGVVEVSIAEVTMTDEEKKVYQKFMAKCVASSSKDKKDAMVACAVDFKKMKEKLMAEDEEEDEEEEEEEDAEKGKSLEEKIKLEEEDLKDDKEYLQELKKKLKKSESATKKQGKMEYNEKPKTPANSVGIITVDQINKWERAEKNETHLDELKETKTVWKNTIDL